MPGRGARRHLGGDVMTDIISAIDQATGCQQCGKPLGSSPSDDFCNEGCQTAWHAGAEHVTAAAGDPEAVGLRRADLRMASDRVFSWSASANGVSVWFCTTDPDLTLFVRPFVAGDVQGLELVDATGARQAIEMRCRV